MQTTHAKPSSHGSGGVGTLSLPLKLLISVCCALHRESRSSQAFPKQTSQPVRICGELAQPFWKNTFINQADQ